MKTASFAAVVAVFTAVSFAAQAQVKIGVVSSATGPTAFVGMPQKNSVALLPTKVGDTTIEYIALDDASDPTMSVSNVKKLLAEQKIDALIGPSGSPNAMGVVEVMAEAQTPMLAPVGTTAVVLPMDAKKRWVFKTTQNDDIIGDALIEHMQKSGVKTVGFIGYNDPYGEAWYKTITPMLQKAGIQVVANERYNRQDTSVSGQVLKLKAAAPDAVFVAGVAAGAALPQRQLAEAGYAGKVYQTHGAATDDFIRIGGKNVEGTIMAASLMLVLDQIPDSVPSKKVAVDYVAAYERMYGNRPATFGANVYDAGLLLQRAIPEALKKGKPGTPEFRAALRDALESTKELVATQGVYNMTAADHSGFDQRGRVLLTVKDGKWALLPN
ncbi:MAG TPA: ABC transporter substrate-binding protein [Casimicrobiaceae bacterium]|nr:ABC transporter substrate-binding protein [Casimicrobiaceae bacterium]